MVDRSVPNSIAKRLLTGDLRALARAISILEDDSAGGVELLAELFPHTGKAYVIGVTGSPGAGKSTLVDQLIQQLSSAGARIAVLAVDPSSPFTGGAILGDRIRMLRSAELPGVFVRSMASRGALGGLAPKTAEVIFTLDAAGFDFIIVETVGVGQGEVEIVRHADTVALVLVPGMGDGVQALKAGIIEIADVFVINKADYPGADGLQKELTAVMGLADQRKRDAKIVQTVASTGSGIGQLVTEIEKHRSWAKESGVAEERKQTFLLQTLEREISQVALKEVLMRTTKSGRFSTAQAEVLARELDPLSAAQALVSSVLKRQR